MPIRYYFIVLVFFLAIATPRTSVYAHQQAFAFIENKGQIVDRAGEVRKDIAFTSTSDGVKLFFTRGGVSYAFARYEPLEPENSKDPQNQREEGLVPDPTEFELTTYRMDVEFVGGNPDTEIEALEPNDVRYNYYYGHCPEGVTDVREYARLRYVDVYPDIDLIYYNGPQGLKYDFIVHPGGNASDIRLRYNGAEHVRLTPQGHLEASTPLGFVREDAPVSYTMNNEGDKRSQLESSYRLEGSTIGFNVGRYDPKQTLVIDPGVLWSTYYGGGANDEPADIALDDRGNSLVVGRTFSVNFPVSSGAIQSMGGGSESDVFILKLDSNGQRVWATYFGGDDTDVANGVDVDQFFNIYFTGFTLSDNFPTDTTSFQQDLNRFTDAFIVKLASSGIVRWSTYYGGNNSEHGRDVAVNPRGDLVALVGWTNAMGSTFPLDNGMKTTNNGARDVFVANLTTFSGIPVWSTFYGGTGNEEATGVAVNDSGEIIVTGITASDDYPVTFDALQSGFAGGGRDGFITKFRGATGDTLWSTYFGGSGGEDVHDIDVDHEGNYALGGMTFSATDFWIENAFQDTHVSIVDGLGAGFLSVFNMEDSLMWSTYLVGDSSDAVFDVAYDAQGALVAVGETNSLTFPVTTDAFQSTLGGYTPGDTIAFTDGFIVRFTPEGDTTLATYYGGPDNDNIQAVTAADDENMYIAGITVGGETFPIFNPAQSDHGGLNDAFIARYGCSLFPTIEVIGETAVCEGESVTLQANDEYAEYLWTNGATTQTIIATVAGDYALTVTDVRGCTVTTEPVEVVVYPLPQPEMTLSGPSLLCFGADVTLDPGDNFEEYEWSTGDDTQTITVSEAGEYTVIVTDDNGCRATTTAIIDVRTLPEPLFSDDLLDFGELEDCDPRRELPLTITNIEDGPITIDSADFGNSAFRVISPELPVTIEAGRQVVLTIEFTPVAAGEIDTDVIFMGSPCEFVHTTGLRGSKQAINVSSDVVEILFGDIFVCDPTVAETTITLTNTSGSEVEILEGNVADPFTIVSPDFPQTVANGGQIEVRIAFDPAAEGAFAETVEFRYSTGLCEATLTIPIDGFGADAELTAESSDIDFGQLIGCDPFVERTVEISNPGGQDITIVSITPSTDFSVPGPTPTEITSGGSEEFVVRFESQSDGVSNGQVMITYAFGPCEKTLIINLAGERQSLAIAANAGVDIGSIVLCAQATVESIITIANESSSAITGRVSAVNLSGPVIADIAVGDEFQQGQSRDYNISITPDAEGPISGSVEIVFEPCDITVTIPITGSATDVGVTAPGGVSLGPLQPGATGTEQLRFSNTGSAAISISAIEGIEPPFSLVAPSLPVTVEPGAEIVVEVAYTAQEGESVANIQIMGGVPCAFSAESSITIIGAEERPVVTITAGAPDLEARTTDRDYHIPLLLVAEENLAQSDADSFRVEMRFNETLFYPQRAEGGTITSNELESGERRVVMEGAFPTDIQINESIVELVGYMKIGNASTMTVNVEEFAVSSAEGASIIQTQVRSGSVHLVNICEVGGSRFLRQRDGVGITSISPNPSDGDVVISARVVNGAPTSLEIHTVGGDRVFKEVWVADSISEHVLSDIEVAIEHTLPVGSYRVTLRSGASSDVKQLIIVR